MLSKDAAREAEWWRPHWAGVLLINLLLLIVVLGIGATHYEVVWLCLPCNMSVFFLGGMLYRQRLCEVGSLALFSGFRLKDDHPDHDGGKQRFQRDPPSPSHWRVYLFLGVLMLGGCLLLGSLQFFLLLVFLVGPTLYIFLSGYLYHQWTVDQADVQPSG